MLAIAYGKELVLGGDCEIIDKKFVDVIYGQFTPAEQKLIETSGINSRDRKIIAF